ncbi:hypothetical protein CesoFtcFv8_003081 [Champsocephalus esox]|uniref:Uncharacterized protein n=2 Tax=Champsocephalus TaxID=52236 RepID=A0AAN8DYP0_CHAGU|nr:hypothetical protein CesoFtcFv8_003081 [Champsocephalus esox]KAK5931751.1 hypothetical protein CgunFtcFv8_003522 [Champsocephalus gunnari]
MPCIRDPGLSRTLQVQFHAPLRTERTDHTCGGSYVLLLQTCASLFTHHQGPVAAPTQQGHFREGPSLHMNPRAAWGTEGCQHALRTGLLKRSAASGQLARVYDRSEV